MLGITCPYCGKIFDYMGDRQTVFCVSCGKKLRVTIQVTGADDPSVSAPATASDSRGTVYTESAGNYGPLSIYIYQKIFSLIDRFFGHTTHILCILVIHSILNCRF